MENNHYAGISAEIASLDEQRESYLEATRLLQEKIERTKLVVRKRLLEQFNEGMATIYVATDDYREQEARFRAAFTKLHKDFHYYSLALRLKMDDALGKK